MNKITIEIKCQIFDDITQDQLRNLEVEVYVLGKRKTKVGTVQPFLNLNYLELEKIIYGGLPPTEFA